jgi:hypothetical protein
VIQIDDTVTFHIGLAGKNKHPSDRALLRLGI